MHIARHSLLISLLLSAGLGLVLGAVLGYPLAGITLGLIVFTFIQIRRFNVLREWLMGDTTQEPPELPGAWGEILDALARMQKRTQAREASLRSIISRFQQSSAALPDAVIIIDRNNNLEWWNLAAERLLGLRHATDRGKPSAQSAARSGICGLLPQGALSGAAGAALAAGRRYPAAVSDQPVWRR